MVRRADHTTGRDPGGTPDSSPPLRIALIGTRGVPARYGGFETAVEEVGRRLVERGHSVTVYCRTVPGGDRAAEHLGMRLVHLPALRRKTLETLSHTLLSAVHAAVRGERFDAAIVFNAGNAVFVPLVRRRRTPVAVHVDGLEWRRAKWSGWGRRYYRVAEAAAVRWADALIADARGIAEYYEEEFGVATRQIGYGAQVLRDLADDRLAEAGLTSRGYHLVVARFEPENHVEMIVRAYRSSAATLPLVVVGSAPYADEYTARIEQMAAADGRVVLLGGVWDQELLDQLYGHARLYLHGHSCGGTNPSLLRAMGAGAAVGAFDVVFNREVLGQHGMFFDDDATLRELLDAAEAFPAHHRAIGTWLQYRIDTVYRWEEVADGYEQLARDLAARRVRRGAASGRRTGAERWNAPLPVPAPGPIDVAEPAPLRGRIADAEPAGEPVVHAVDTLGRTAVAAR